MRSDRDAGGRLTVCAGRRVVTVRAVRGLARGARAQDAAPARRTRRPRAGRGARAQDAARSRGISLFM